MITTVTEWLASSGNLEIRNNEVAAQLEQLDKVGTGIGWIWALTPVESETIPPDDAIVAAVAHAPEQELQLASQAVFKIRDIWYIAADENISDIACALVRIIMQNMPKQQ